MGEQKERLATFPSPSGLTPTVIVGYLVVYWLWAFIGPRTPLFFAEPFDCAFLLVVAGLLWRAGKAREIPRYFLGKWVPDRADIPTAGLVLLFLIGWLILTISLGWQPLGAARPFDRLRFADENVIGPITQEAVHRGVILAILLASSQTGRPMALVLSALLFASIHSRQDVYEVLTLFGGGLLLGYGYMVTRSVPFCALCHAMVNAVLYLAEQNLRTGR